MTAFVCLSNVSLCAANRSEEALKEAGRKAARTRAERYGEELKVSAPENDDLQGAKTTSS